MENVGSAMSVALLGFPVEPPCQVEACRGVEGRERATGAHRHGAKAARERADTCGMIGVIGRVARECKDQRRVEKTGLRIGAYSVTWRHTLYSAPRLCSPIAQCFRRPKLYH